MKIEIKSIKISLKWWQLALVIAIITLSLRAPELVASFLQKFFGSS